MGNFGYGQFTPWTESSEANSLFAIIKSVMAQMETMRLVKVMAVNPGAGTPPIAGTVDVHPLVNQVDGNGNATPHGTIHGVPYVRLAGGDSGIILEPAVGDIGYVVCEGRDASNVIATGKEANPGSFRMFDLSDGVYLGGVIAPAVPAQYLWFAATGLTLLDRNGNKWVGSATGIDITPKSGQPVTIHGNEIVTGTLEVDGTSDLKGNVHAEGTMTVDGALSALTLQIGGTTVVKRAIVGTGLSASSSVGGQSSLTFDFTVTGVHSGDFVILSAPAPSNPQVNLAAFCPSNGTVRVVVQNPTVLTQAFTFNTSALVFGTT